MNITQTMLSALIGAGMSQKRIAEALGCKQPAVSLWLAGKRVPRGDTMMRLVALHGGRTSG